MKKIIWSILLIAFCAFASENDSISEKGVPQRYLKLLTNPLDADAFINTSNPDFASNPDYTLPDIIEVPGNEDHIIVTLFRPEYADTTIDIRLSTKDTSYLNVSLRQTYDIQETQKQNKIVAHRIRRQIGHRLMLVSTIPLAAGGVAALIAKHEIDLSKGNKKYIENSRIQNGDSYQNEIDEFSDHKSNAKTAKKAMFAGLIAGGIILTTGIILSF